ncbi:MAG: UvrD-helicase domain-containing protein, partial [Alphaproteobacteria bacterium]|nr:UvrD-helicase domain-containing protein [Alphaproteobacteria bacterium]
MNKFDIKKFDSTKNYVIEASAGTGKTYTILEIIKKLLLNHVCSLQEILVVTYTEKATGELKNRLRQCIYDNKSLLQDEFYNIDNAQISTIHGFCQNVLQEFAFNANLTLQQELISDSDTDKFLLKWLTDKVKNNDDNIINILNNDWNIDKIKKILKELLKHYYLNNDYQEDKKIISFVGCLSKEIYEQIPLFKENLQVLENSNDEKAQMIFKTITENLTNNQSVILTMKNTFKDDDLKQAYGFFKNVFKRDEKKEIENISILQILKELYTDLQKYKIQNKVQTFNDMLRSVREEICKKDSSLLSALRKKYKYVIIDEFQDTNQIQWDIFKNIFMQDTEHHLIVVGDPEQSIYSFQGADLVVYHSAKKEIADAGGLIENLSDNWRSSKDMIDACNALFQENFFCWNDNIDFTESSFPTESKHAFKMKFHGDDIAPIWLCNDCTESSFANIVVKKIIECCSFDENGKTNLQICDNGKLRNVYFNDFAIIAKERANMKNIEETLTKFGVPFVKYKDTNLFNGSECANWIMLLKAIDSNDFTGNKRKVLSGGLFTKFFNTKINDLENSEYDDVSNYNRQLFIYWHNLAKSHQWAKLIECIFENTRIEENLSSMDNLQTLSIYRQISNYILDYLYKNRCSLKKVIKHLTQISSGKSAVENDENIIEKGTDFNCVKLMTIHSSKGLEFPIVINASASTVTLIRKDQVTFTHHDTNANKVINLFPVGKECYKQEAIAELQRLFYVSYTRASSLMILPCYTEWKEDYSFLNNVFQNFKEKHTDLYLDISQEQDDFKYTVKDIIKNISKSDDVIQNTTTDIVKERQNLIRKIPELLIYKHSYSSLSHGKKETEEDLTNENSKRIDSEGAIDAESLAMYDMNGKSIDCEYNQDVKKTIPEDAPRGATFGTAIHEVLENTDFSEIGKLFVDDSADKLMPTIIKCFEKQSIHVDADKINLWNIPQMIFDTLNAKFPEIIGHKATGDVFKLSSLVPNQCKPEIEFNLNTEVKFKNYYDGF